MVVSSKSSCENQRALKDFGKFKDFKDMLGDPKSKSVGGFFAFSGHAVCMVVWLFKCKQPEACMNQTFSTSACLARSVCAMGHVSPFALGQRGKSGLS